MKDKEKALEITKDYAPTIENLDAKIVLYDALMEMAEWKDKQFQEEKKQLIEKACKEHCNCCGYAYMAAVGTTTTICIVDTI